MAIDNHAAAAGGKPSGAAPRKTMRAVICEKLGPMEALDLGEALEPEVGPHQLLIDVAVAGVNFPDQLIIKGQYQAMPELPFSPGFEVAGVISAIGEGISDFAVGERVIALTHGSHGGYAEKALADEDRVIAIPQNWEMEAAAAFYSSYGTAYHALVQRGQLKAGETLVVLGAGGGVGLAAIDIAKAIGAKIIAVAGSDDKLEAGKKHGADFCINHKTEDVKARLQALTAGKGVDVCIDPVGGELFDVLSRQMGWNGRLLVLGFASGSIPSLRVNIPMLKCYQLVGVFWDSFCKRFPDENRRNFTQLFAWYDEGLIHPEIQSSYRLEQFALALKELERGQSIGRIVLRV